MQVEEELRSGKQCPCCSGQFGRHMEGCQLSAALDFKDVKEWLEAHWR